MANAGRELGRFLQYADSTAAKPLARARAKALVERSSITGPGAALWVGLGEQVDYYDKANYGYYNLCNFSTRLATEVLPITHSRSPTLRLRAQSLSRAQLNEACTIVGGEESYFHTAVKSGAVPVANDNNTQLGMVVFSSSQDYGTYAGAIYGIDTNNGGMYLEGAPDAPGNQPRFIAYQAGWLLPKLEIWNLTHEYIHCLDGRFDMYGDFNAAMSGDFRNWLPCVNNPALAQCSGTNAPPKADFTTSVSGLTARFTSTATDSDGTITTHAWNFGDGTTASSANPSKTYGTAGTYTVTLTVTDDKGAQSAVKSQSVTVAGSPSLPECPGSASSSAGTASARTCRPAPAITPTCTCWSPLARSRSASSSGGGGNADMYANTLGRWATSNDYNYGSYNAGNSETIVVNNPPAGYMYISLHAQTAFSGAQLKVDF